MSYLDLVVMTKDTAKAGLRTKSLRINSYFPFMIHILYSCATISVYSINLFFFEANTVVAHDSHCGSTQVFSDVRCDMVLLLVPFDLLKFLLTSVLLTAFLSEVVAGLNRVALHPKQTGLARGI